MVATLDGRRLEVNPRGVAWDYSLKTNKVKTIGGSVIQIYGVKMGDLRVTGKMNMEDYRVFFERTKVIVDKQVPTPSNAAPAPVRFAWPERGWDFWVYIKGLVSGGSSVAMLESNANFAPEYTLTLFVVEDNANIITVVEDSAKAAFIARISQGLGWVQSTWNGPMDITAEYQAALDGKTALQFLFDKEASLRTDPAFLSVDSTIPRPDDTTPR